jgi:3-hydroxy acid dehydrogenase / malonic semialdehyde reductase
MTQAPIAMITGASSGIGEATARALADAGYALIITARRSDKLEALAEKLRAIGASVHTLVFDVRDEAAVEAAVTSLPESWRSIRVLVNNAGLALGLAPIDKGNPDHWETMLDTNVKGLLHVTRFVLPLINKDGSGHIVNIGSIAGKQVYANGAVYCASKYAVDALTQGMRIDLAHIPIRVGSVCPGAVETEFSLVRFEGNAEKAASVYQGFENLVATDIADAICWMLSRPKHVNINDIVIMPTAQPNASTILRKNA